MSYTSGANYRNIKSFSGGRGAVSKVRSESSRLSNLNTKANSAQTSLLGETSSSNSNIALTAQLKTYSNLATNSITGMEKSGSRLTSTEENSLFDKAEKSGSTTNVVSEATDFVNNYNNLMTSITKLGGSENKKFASQMADYAEENKDVLAKIGITVLKDGSLTMNRNEMKKASLEDLKAAFNGEDSFAGKVAAMGEDIKENVETKYKENLLILGSSTGKNSSSNSSYSSLANYFNMSV